MPFTDKIVTEINAQLLSEIFSKGELQGSKLFGIGFPQARSDNPIDYLITGYIDGNQQDFTYDDSASSCLYHRQLQASLTPIPTGSFGRETQQTETAFMNLVLWGKRDRIKMHESTLASWIASVININFNPSAFEDFKVNKMSVSATNINFDSASVFQAEYKQSYPFGIEIIYFSIQYKIETSYNKGCFNTCPEC